MTCKIPDNIRRTSSLRPFSKVRFLLPIFFLSLSSIAFLLFLLPVHFVLAYSPVSSNAFDAATNDDSTGALDVTGGEYGSDKDYDYELITGRSFGVLKIHPRSSSTEIEVKNKNYSEEAKDCIQITSEATVKLSGVNINDVSDDGISPVTVDDGTPAPTYNVKILLVDGTENILKGNLTPGVRKVTSGNLTIGVPEGSKGTGKLDATGEDGSAGIGGADSYSTSNITITGGNITAKGGRLAPGIGSGFDSMDAGITTSDITITGGNVTAIGGGGAAGIGGGKTGGNVSNIHITGGVVTAIGGLLGNYQGAGIGGGAAIQGTVSGNKISGNAVVMAASAGDSKPALEGFDNSDIKNCIVFTGVGTAFDSEGRATAESWTESEMHDNVVLSKNLEIPIDLTVPNGQILSIEKDKTIALTGKDVAKYTVEGELQNNGTVTLPTNLEFGESGKITTLLNYDPQGGEIVTTNDDDYITFQDTSGIKTYESLPNAEKEGYELAGWYTKEEGQGIKVEKGDTVLLNEHMLYADWREVGPSPEPTPDTKEGWDLDETGWRYFVDNDAISGWKWIDDTYGAHWYFFGDDTYMVTSTFLKDNGYTYWVCSTGPMITKLWQWINNEWYGFWWDGKMCTGWVWDTDWNAWFYCYQNGIMARNTWQDAYYLDWRGVWLH